MMAIFTPLRCDGRGFDARGGGLQIEERAPAARAGDVIGLENARAGGLQDVVGQAQRLPGRFFALHENGVADAVAEQRADVGRRGEQSLRENPMCGDPDRQVVRSGYSVSFSRIGCRGCSFAASRRKAAMTGRSTPSATVTSCGASLRVDSARSPRRRADRLRRRSRLRKRSPACSRPFGRSCARSCRSSPAGRRRGSVPRRRACTPSRSIVSVARR